jgi:hypothetical protein
MRATLLYRGLISGYTAVEAAFVGNKDVGKGWLRGDVVTDLGFL